MNICCLKKMWLLVVAGIALLPSGCVTSSNKDFDQAHTQRIEESLTNREPSFTREMEEKILTLDAERVTEKDISEVLSNAPAPRIIVIHGGVFRYSIAVKSFSKFLIGMGYPEWSVRNPKTGDYTYYCYEDSGKFAGEIAWYYEQQGLRPMIVGHSVGGMQAIKILHTLAEPAAKLSVWNPFTETKEDRTEIKDPFTGELRPVAGLQLCYVTTLASGGLARTVTSNWKLGPKTRIVPDTVEEFTGFYIGMDWIGGDNFGNGPANEFAATGSAAVRNVRLPNGASHSFLPAAQGILKSQTQMDLINNYTPDSEPKGSSARIIWVSDVWHSIKKHWVLELQRCIRAKREMHS